MINIAKLLKDAPEGMKLYSPMLGEVEFKYINDSKFGIVVQDSEECYRSFDKYGRYFTIYNNAECLLFPSKDCRTWEGWKVTVEPKFKVGSWLYHNSNGVHPVLVTDYDERHGYQIQDGSGRYHLSRNLTENEYHLWTIQDAKDGDVLVHEDYIFIFKYILHGGVHLYCHYNIDDEEFDYDIPDAIIGNIHDKGAHFQPATKEQHILLFAKMKEAGYQWDADKKELRKIQPHYDIINFKPFDKVLVRDEDDGKWVAAFYSHYMYEEKDYPYQFATIGTDIYGQCVPYNDDTKHLLGTTDMCDEQYINW